jgi:hypothetical protein
MGYEKLVVGEEYLVKCFEFGKTPYLVNGTKAVVLVSRHAPFRVRE